MLLFALAAAMALFARLFHPKLDIDKERHRVASKVCSQPSLADARSVLDELRFDDVFVLPDEKKIAASKSYAAFWSKRAVVYVRIDASGTPTRCRVEGFYVGE